MRLLAADDVITMDPHELSGACWMLPEEIRALVVPTGQSLDGKVRRPDRRKEMDLPAVLLWALRTAISQWTPVQVSESNWTIIENALHGALIVGSSLRSARGPPAMLYTAARSPAGTGSSNSSL